MVCLLLRRSARALGTSLRYERMGNSIAVQYGGSEAHSSFFQRRRGHWESTLHSRDVLTSIRRFYSNAITDAEKQARQGTGREKLGVGHGAAAIVTVQPLRALAEGDRERSARVCSLLRIGRAGCDEPVFGQLCACNRQARALGPRQ